MNAALKNSLILAAAAFSLLGAPAMRAQSLTFTVDINTAGLSADSANAPFYLDFAMIFGNSSLASNTATLSNFSLTGGTAVGSAVVASGSATGNLGGTITLTESAAHPDSEIYQQFSAGTTDIQFKATVTETGPDVGPPSTFSTSILDNSLTFPAQLYTTAPDTQSLVLLNLDASNTIANVGAYTALQSADGNTPITGVTALVAIPEPSSYAAILGCAGLLLAFFARRSGLLRAV